MLSHPPSLSGIVYREHGNAGNFSHQWLVLLNLQYPRGDGKPVRSIFSEVKSRVGGRCNQNLPPNLDLSNRTEIPPWIKTKYSNLFPCLPLCGIKEIACRKNSFLWRHPMGFCRQHLLQTEVGFVIGAARESLFRVDAWQVIPDRYCFTSSLNFDRIRESESVRKQINDREPREIRGRLRHCERWQVSISHWPYGREGGSKVNNLESGYRLICSRLSPNRTYFSVKEKDEASRKRECVFGMHCCCFLQPSFSMWWEWRLFHSYPSGLQHRKSTCTSKWKMTSQHA